MNIQLIMGSTRPSRVSPTIVEWIVANLPESPDNTIEIIDLKEHDLPIFNEAAHPSMGQYALDHTKAWSEKIKQGDAYIFLTPEYNAGYPAALKNAIDYLYHEWTDKPVMIVSYGVGGGTTASAQLRQVAERLKMKPVPTSPALIVTREMSDENGQLKDITTDFEPYVSSLKESFKELLDPASIPEEATDN